MKYIKKIYDNCYLYILSFFILLFIFIFILMISQINPFGPYTYIKGDMRDQLLPFLIKYKSIILNGNYLYDWTEGLGIPVMGMILTYLMSPLNIIILLFKDVNIEYAIHVITFLKLLLITYSMIFYLKRRIKSNSILLIIPALLYTFCGFVLRYYIFYQWLDMLYILPLLTYSIELLIDKKKINLYIIMIVFTIFSSVYIGYMLCIYTAIYFILYNFLNINGTSILNKINNMSKNFLIILSSTIIALLIISPILYIYYKLSMNFGNIGGGFVYNRIYDFTYLDFLSDQLGLYRYNININDFYHNSPNIYCGIISFLMIIPFIFNNKVNIKNKLLYICLLIVFIMIFRIPMLDFIINVFHIPNGAPYRYSFIYSFLLCVMLGYSLINKDNKTYPIIISMISTIIILIFQHDIKLEYMIISIISTVLISISLMKRYKFYEVVLLSIIVIELLIQSNMYFNKHIKIGYNYDVIKYNYDDNYRIGYFNSKSLNQGYLSNVNTISSFNSANYGLSSNYLNKFGNPGLMSNIEWLPNTCIFNSLFNIKYVNYNYNDDMYTQLYDDMYEYKYPLSRIFGVDNYLDDNELLNDDPIGNQNRIIYSFTGIENVLVPVDVNEKIIYKNDDVIVFEYDINDTLYYYYNSNDGVLFTYHDGNVYSTVAPKKKFLNELGFNDYKVQQIINNFVTISKEKIIVGYFDKGKNNTQMLFYKIDNEKFMEAYNYLFLNQANINSMNNKGLTATISLEKDMNIYTTIPYDDCWTLYVDNKESEVYRVNDVMLGFYIPKGEHNIELKYSIPGLKKYIIVSILTILSLLLYNIIVRRIKHGNK